MSLNYIVIHRSSDFKIIIDSPVLVTGSRVLKDEETAINMWCVSFDDTMLESFSKEQFEEFVDTVIDKKKQQIAEINSSFPFTFYMWFDEMVAQLRFNIISGHSRQLPFRCRIEVIDSIEPVWQELKGSYHQGLSWSELEFFEDDIEDDAKEYILKVYVKTM